MNKRFIINGDIFILDDSGLLSFKDICNYLIHILQKKVVKGICSGFMYKSFVLIDINPDKCDSNCIEIINQQLQPKKIYLLPISQHLYKKCKVAIPGDFYDEVIGLDGSERNFSNWGNFGQIRWIVPDLQDKIENDPITKQKYGPSIQRTWLFEQPCSHAEWMLRDSCS